MSDETTKSRTEGTSAAERVVSAEIEVCRGGGASSSACACPSSACDCEPASPKETCTCSPAAVKLAEELYRNVTMGADSYLHTLPHVDEPGDPLKTDITAALCYYEKLAAKVSDRLAVLGGKADEEGKMTKAMAHAGIAMNAMKDRTSSHIAEMLIEGCTMSVTAACRLKRELVDALKRCNGADGRSAVEELITLCQNWSEFEEAHIERLKEHL